MGFIRSGPWNKEPKGLKWWGGVAGGGLWF